ncbi:hypothetical protein D6J03_04880 [Legionella taurinensis]|nr:hypothetical protein D6J03_04880 [Legionella taurinensis]
MPKYDLILNLPGFSIRKVKGYQPLWLELSYNRLPRCDVVQLIWTYQLRDNLLNWRSQCLQEENIQRNLNWMRLA